MVAIYQDDDEEKNGSNFHGFVEQIRRVVAMYQAWVCRINMTDGCCVSGRRRRKEWVKC